MKPVQKNGQKDITRRNLEIACRLAKVGSFVVYTASNQLFLSDEARNIMDIQETGLIDMQTMLNYFDQNERQKVENTLNEILVKGQSNLVSFQLTTPRGALKWIRGFGDRVEDEEGVRIEGALQDITQVKNREEDSRNMDLLIRSIFEINPDMLFLLDKEGRILDYRAQDKAQLYSPPEDFLNKTVMEAIPRAQAQAFMEAISVAKEGNPEVFEFPLKDKHYECRLARIHDEEKYFAIVREITDRHLAQEALKAREIQLKNLLEQSPFPVIISGLKEGRFLYANARAKSRFGVEEEFIGLKAVDYYKTPQIREAFLELLFREGSVDDFEIILLDFEKKPYWATVSATFVDFEGEEAIMMAINDISERRRMEKSIKRERDRLKERIKEQRCIQEVLTLTENMEGSLPAVMPGIARALARGFSLPDEIGIEIIIDNAVYSNGLPQGDGSQLEAVYETKSKRAVVVRAGYPKGHRFLYEENVLVNHILHRIGETVDRREEVKSSKKRKPLWE